MLSYDYIYSGRLSPAELLFEGCLAAPGHGRGPRGLIETFTSRREGDAMIKVQIIAHSIETTFKAFYAWRERQKSSGVEGLPGWALFLLVSLTGLASSTLFLSLAALLPQFEALVNCWSIMPSKIKVGTLLLTISVLAWAYVAFRFSLLFTVYRRECVRRLEM
jgi:hypothetical protein